MRLLPWSASRDKDGGGVAPASAPTDRAMTAAGERLAIKDRGQAERIRKRAKDQSWQHDAWAYFDAIPEVKAALRYRASMVSKVRISAAYVPNPGEAPILLDSEEPPEEVDERTRSVCLDTIARLDQSSAGIGGLLAEAVVNLDAPGEFYLVGIGARQERLAMGQVIPGTPEQWEIMSIDEVEATDDGGWKIKAPFKALPDGHLEEGVDFIVRLWQMHPRRSELADSALHGVLDVCEELLILNRAARAWALSRLNAGLLAVSNDFSFGPPDPTVAEGGGDSKDQFKKDLTDAVTIPIQNEGSASAVVPVMLFGPTDAIEKGLKHLTFDRAIDDKLDQRIELRVKRLARGLDAPVEKVLGHQETTFANAAQVDIDDFRAYLEPTLMQLCLMLTTGYYRPFLEAAGVDPALIRRLVVWYDPSELLGEPDRGPAADAAHERYAISDAAYRRERGFSEEDAPDEQEILVRMGLKRGITDAPLTEVLLRLLDAALPTPKRSGDEPVEAAASVAASLPLALAAGAPRASIGQRLMNIDRTLRTRIEALADLHTRRALEKAGARIRSRATAAAATRAAVGEATSVQVAARLGRAMVASLGLSEDELLEGSFDSLRDEFETRVERAQSEALAVVASVVTLTTAEREELERRQREDRDEAWTWFLAALLAVARTRMFDPSPEAPASGEFDELVTVPPAVVREAVARAGGAVGLESRGGALTVSGGQAPAGGIGTGRLVAETLADHGNALVGWQWVYGDPSTRGRNFEPHRELDGSVVASWSDPKLTRGEKDTWLVTTSYMPGDHPYCQCDFAPVYAGTVSE